MQRFRCTCGQPLFFDNRKCERCGHPVGFDPVVRTMVTLSDARGGLWEESEENGRKSTYRFCANGIHNAACNWLIPFEDAQELCAACLLNRTIPDLSRPVNLERWTRLEAAKRRLLYTLLWLRLPIASHTQDPQAGLAFDFLEDSRSNPLIAGEPVATGHSNGVITINVMEADPVERVRAREHMNEQYRTLLGHMRHESGHYYWDRLIKDSSRLGPFREHFGDERSDYAAALDLHYRDGPPDEWAQSFISSYASAHPWEDWAETWAHYLHIVDTLDTAKDFGVIDRHESLAEGTDAFDASIAAWMEVSVMLNELNRSMGQGDGYPFVVPPTVVAKLRFVHDTVQEAGGVTGSPNG